MYGDTTPRPNVRRRGGMLVRMDQSKPPLVAIGDDDAASPTQSGTSSLNAKGFETAQQERLCAAGSASSYHDDVQARNGHTGASHRTAAPRFSGSDSTVTANAIISSIPNP